MIIDNAFDKELASKYKEILELFCVSKPIGYSIEELESVKQEVGDIPYALAFFYLNYGKTVELLHLQDFLILPNRYKALLNEDYIIFFNENQGVCEAGVRKADALQPDPPVYVRMDNKEWILSEKTVSDFLIAMYGYQASLCSEYSPEEFYFITVEEKERIEKLFQQRPESFKNWMDCDITLFGDNNHGRIAIMNQENYDIQMIYAANTQEEFQRMEKLLAGIGEAM